MLRTAWILTAVVLLRVLPIHAQPVTNLTEAEAKLASLGIEDYENIFFFSERACSVEVQGSEPLKSRIQDLCDYLKESENCTEFIRPSDIENTTRYVLEYECDDGSCTLIFNQTESECMSEALEKFMEDDAPGLGCGRRFGVLFGRRGRERRPRFYIDTDDLDHCFVNGPVGAQFSSFEVCRRGKFFSGLRMNFGAGSLGNITGEYSCVRQVLCGDNNYRSSTICYQ